MPVQKKKTSFANTEEMAEIRAELEEMAKDSAFNTASSFSANSEKYPDSKIPFVDKHMSYLMSHRGINPRSYVSNLRLMTKIR